MSASYSIERRGTTFAPWVVVHRGSGMAVPVLRPYPGVDDLPPIEVCNHRSREEAELAAQEIDWSAVDQHMSTPAMRALAERARQRREFDAAYQVALVEARAGRGPWPWEPDGLLHRVVALPVGDIQASLFDTDSQGSVELGRGGLMGSYTTREFIDTFGGLPERGDRNHAVDRRELVDQCSCRSAGPDADGNYDQLEDPDCPRHAAMSEEQK